MRAIVPRPGGCQWLHSEQLMNGRTSFDRSQTRASAKPIAHHVTLKAKFVFEQSIQSFTILAGCKRLSVYVHEHFRSTYHSYR